MVITTTMRDGLANAFDDVVNTGGGTANLKLETSGDVEVATFDFANPAFGAASTGVITLASVPIQDASATGGTVAQGSIYSRGGTKLSESVAATSGQEITVSSTTVGAGEVVTLTALTVTVPAS
jgi:hypothetical protein